MIEPILHHYPMSPFAEKIRVALGIKGIAWRSVVIPRIMPKPDLMPLTGGYRKTPVLQILRTASWVAVSDADGFSKKCEVVDCAPCSDGPRHLTQDYAECRAGVCELISGG